MERLLHNGKLYWVSEPPTLNELNSMPIDLLVILAKSKRGLKDVLIEFILKHSQQKSK